MAYTTHDCIEFEQDGDGWVYMDSSLAADLEIRSKEDVVIRAGQTSTQDGHEISFYFKAGPGVGTPVCGFSYSNSGFVINTTLVLDSGAKLMSNDDLTIRHNGGGSTLDITVEPKDELLLDFDSEGTASGAKCKFMTNGTVSLEFASDGSGAFTGDVTVENTWADCSQGLRVPTRTSHPSSPSQGELYYNPNNHRIYAYDGSAWLYAPLST